MEYDKYGLWGKIKTWSLLVADTKNNVLLGERRMIVAIKLVSTVNLQEHLLTCRNHIIEFVTSIQPTDSIVGTFL